MDIQLFVGIVQLCQSIALFVLINVYTSNPCRLSLYMTNYSCADRIFNLTYGGCSIVPVIPLVSAISELYQYGLKTSNRYHEVNMNETPNSVRFIEYTFSAGLMLWIICSLSGISSLDVLVLVQIMNALLQYCGYSIEYNILMFGVSTVAVNDVKNVALSLYVSTWLVIFTHFYYAVSSSSDGPPPVVYAICPTMFVLFCLFGVNQHLWSGGFISYHTCDVGYSVLSIVVKTILVWMIYGGIARKDVRDNP
jgi:hypothetical protein